MTRLSIRLRLTLWYAVAMSIGLALFASALWWALEQRLIAGVDARLDQRLRVLQQSLTSPDADINSRAQLLEEIAEFTAQLPAGDELILRDRDGAAINTARPRFAPDPGGRPYQTLTLDHRPYRVETRDLNALNERFVAILAEPLDEPLAVLHDMRRLLFVLVPICLLAACLGGYWISSRALRPVSAITDVAASISVHNLSQRVAVPPTGDELQRMAETWNAVLSRLEQSVENIRRFTADASHELRTPLSLIRTTAELACRRDRTPAEYREALGKIHSISGEMTELAEQLLQLARSDSATGRIDTVEVKPGELISEIARRIAPAASEKGIAVVTSITAGIEVRCSPPAVRHILMILTENALRHTPPGGTIQVAAAPVDQGVEIAVDDSGPGIPEQALPHIFERFYRADESRSTPGYGLGLSIAQTLARAQNSVIVAANRPSGGAHFALTLEAASPKLQIERLG